jgi:hypothetical protein
MKKEPQPKTAVPANDDPCHSRLKKIAARDPFLAQADQRPLLDQEIDQLSQRLEAHDQGVADQFGRLAAEIRDNLGELSSSLEETQAHLVRDLAPLSGPTPVDATMLQGLEAKLDRLVRTLSRRARTRLLRALAPVAPARQIVPTLIERLERFRRETVESLPEELLLLQPRLPDARVEPGRRLLDVEVVPRLPSLCRSKLLARLRFNRLRRRLKLRYRLMHLPFRDIAADALILRSGLDVAALVSRQEQTHEELQERLTDAWRGIRYNLDSAVVDLGDLQTEPTRREPVETGEKVAKLRELSALVIAAFERARQLLEEVAVTYTAKLDGVVAEIRQDHRNLVIAIREGVDQASSLRGRLRWGRKSLQKSLARGAGRWQTRLNKLFGRTVERGRLLWLRVLHLWYTLRPVLGLKQDIQETQLRLSDLPSPSEMAEQARALPPIYRRLFTPEPLLSREFLVARDEEFRLLQNALERWQSGRTASVAIVGPEGSGKSSLLNCLENELDTSILVTHVHVTERVRTVSELCRLFARTFEMAPAPDRVEGLIAALLTVSRRVVIVEQAHHLLLRVIGGREVLEAFFRLMMATHNHFLWLVSSRQYPWQRMEYLLDARRYFTSVIQCAFHDENELREALLRRERVTGHELHYAEGNRPGARIRKLRLSHPLESAAVQQALSEEYFARLYELSGGNMSAALFFWLQSLRAGADGRMTVEPCITIDDSFIQNLDRRYHFTLAEVVGHGTLSVAEHGEIFRLDETSSRLRLHYLYQIRLLEIVGDPSGPEASFYEVSPVFHKPVTRTLLNFNVLY